MDQILPLFRRLAREQRDLDYGEVTVKRVDVNSLTPLSFFREYVSQNKPVIITGAIGHWPALSLWTDEYLQNKLGGAKITVALTPDGWADAILEAPQQDAGREAEYAALSAAAGLGSSDALQSRLERLEVGSASEGQAAADRSGNPVGPAPADPPLPSSAPVFVMPNERQMPFDSFLDLFYGSRKPKALGTKVVPYMQRQNNNLREEFSPLLSDIDRDPAFFTEAFGAPPDAVNLWFGDGRSTTSFHKDNYENIYAVISGEKHFSLVPPAETWRMHMRRCQVAQYHPEDGKESLSLEAKLVEPPEEVVWCPVRTAHPDPASCPHFFDPSLPRPLEARVRPGEILYLPAMWFHEVRQVEGPQPGQRPCTVVEALSGVRRGERAVSVNFWFDMRFGFQWAQLQFIRGLAVAAGLADPDPKPPAGWDSDSESDSAAEESEEAADPEESEESESKSDDLEKGESESEV